MIGSPDIFRNDRIGEHDNATLAVGLLATRPTVIWLDVHRGGARTARRRERRDRRDARAAFPQAGQRTGDGGFGRARRRTRRHDPPPGVAGDGSGDDQGGTEPPTLWEAFPAALWAILAGVLLMLLVLALWRARRLGRPVREPLPVSVRGAETLLGRARLYQRAKATATSLETLRQTLRPRIAEGLGLPPTADPQTLADAVTARLGGDPEKVADALADAWPTTEKAMLRHARMLHRIHDEVPQRLLRARHSRRRGRRRYRLWTERNAQRRPRRRPVTEVVSRDPAHEIDTERARDALGRLRTRGRQGRRRPGRHRRRAGDRPALPRPRAAGGRARSGEDAARPRPRRGAATWTSSGSSSRPT